MTNEHRNPLPSANSAFTTPSMMMLPSIKLPLQQPTVFSGLRPMRTGYTSRTQRCSTAMRTKKSASRSSSEFFDAMLVVPSTSPFFCVPIAWINTRRSRLLPTSVPALRRRPATSSVGLSLSETTSFANSTLTEAAFIRETEVTRGN